VDSPERWALGPNHHIVNRFIGSLTKIDGDEWVGILSAPRSPSGSSAVRVVQEAAAESGRGPALATARQLAKQAVGWNHWAGPRWQDQAAAGLAELGGQINAVEAEFLAAALACEAAEALVCLDLISSECAEHATAPFRGTSALLPVRDALRHEIDLMSLAFGGDHSASLRLAEISDGYADTAGQIQWLLLAAEAGRADSYVKLGQKCLDVGEDDEAHKWLSRAARAGDVEAMLLLSREADRWGDYDQSDRWLLSAAEAGSAEAMNAMGRRVHNDGLSRLGLSVDERVEQATYWYTRAAEAGSTDAMRTLALWAESGGDAEGAARWRARAEVPAAGKAHAAVVEPQPDRADSPSPAKRRWWQLRAR